MIVDPTLPGLAAVFVGLTVFFTLFAFFAPVKQKPLGSERAIDPAVNLVPDEPLDGIGRYVQPILRNFLPQLPISSISKERKTKIEELLVKSGNPWRLNAEEYFGAQIAFAIIGALIGLGFAFLPFLPPVVPAFAWIILFGLLGFFIPYARYTSHRDARAREVQKQLPEALDLLKVTLDSGQTFEPAMRSITEQLPLGLLRQEFTKINLELSAGSSLERALTTFAHGVASEEAESFAKAVVQSQKLGSDVSETLSRQAAYSRENYEALLERMIARLNTLLIVPLVLTMMPALLAIFLAPTLSQLLGTL